MILTIAHQKGGVGKSTIAFNLAIEIERQSLFPRIQVVDLDLQKSLLFANQIRKQNLIGLNFIDSVNLNQIIKSSEKNTLTLVDCGGFDSAHTRVAIIGADTVIIPISNKPFEIAGLKKFEETLKELEHIKKEKINAKVIFNKIDPRVKRLENFEKFIKASQMFEILDTRIAQRSDFIKSLELGKSVVEYNHKSKASQEIQQLISELL